MKKIFLIVIACLFCISCGVKSKPEYKSQTENVKLIYLI